jgi:signal transduction histidine kinase
VKYTSPKEGIGLSSIQSRAENIDGVVKFDTSSGFEVRIELKS